MPERVRLSDYFSVKQFMEQDQHFRHDPPSALFPLPLTSIEKLMLDDDLPGYPRIFNVVVEFAGALNQSAFEKTMLEVIRRNPLLSSLVRKLKSRWHWIHTPFPLDQITWGLPERDAEYRPIDLRKTPGFRVSGSTDGTTSYVRLFFHHAVCDGQGTGGSSWIFARFMRR